MRNDLTYSKKQLIRLSIDGVQPSIPENPPAQSKDQLQTESANPLAKLGGADAKENKLGQARIY